MNGGSLIREARHTAGLTQDQLARRLGVKQSALARLESARSNPTLATLQRVVAATGQQLELKLSPARSSVDVSLLREALRLSPAERIAAGEQLGREAERLAKAGARSRTRRRARA